MERDGVWTLDHQLEYETAHFAALTILGRTIVEDGDVASPLQQAMEVISVDGHLVFDGRQFVGVA